jgi:hypothetical protein
MAELYHVEFCPWRVKPDARVKMSASYWRKPISWNKSSTGRPRVMVTFDVFEDWQGRIVDAKGAQISFEHHRGEPSRNDTPVTMTDLRNDLFAMIDQTPNLDWMLLTKRPGNIRKMAGDKFRPNVHLYYSASDQPSLESGIDDLLACRDLTPTLGLSLEPLVGEIVLDLFGTECDVCGNQPDEEGMLRHGRGCYVVESDGGGSTYCEPQFDHVIIGGESGHGARTCRIEWIRSLVRQCREAGVACFVKQLGANPMARSSFTAPCLSGGNAINYVNWKTTDPKGVDPKEWPEDLRGVRQFPKSFEGVRT